MSYADRLRALATYLDNHPVIAEKYNSDYDYPSVHIYTNDWDEFQETISHLDGYEKNGGNDNLTATHRETIEVDDNGWKHTNTIFRVCVNVSGVCEARPKIDEETGEVVTRKKRVFVETDEEEVVMEYDCPKVWSV